MSKSSRRRQPPSQTASTPTGPAAAGTKSPARPSTSPVGSARVGRRERARAAYKPSFTERYRAPIVLLAAIAGVVLLSAFVFTSASAPAYACTQEWTPQPTASSPPDASPNPGYVQPDLGNRHVEVGTKITYTYCPPASGQHYNQAQLGPIPPRLYGPDDRALPEGWVHNLEHGGLVILYRGDGPGATSAGQESLRALLDGFPSSPRCGIAPSASPGVVMARFDTMSTPFTAIVWGRVLPLDNLDETQILQFWKIWGERSNPEQLCQPASPAPSVGASPGAEPSPSGEPGTSPQASDAASASPS